MFKFLFWFLIPTIRFNAFDDDDAGGSDDDDVLDDNDGAIRLYEKAGMHQVPKMNTCAFKKTLRVQSPSRSAK